MVPDCQLLRYMADQVFRIAVDLWVSIVVIFSRNMIAGMQDNVESYKGWCKKCASALSFAPEVILEIGDDGYPFATDPERCNGCGLC